MLDLSLSDEVLIEFMRDNLGHQSTFPLNLVIDLFFLVYLLKRHIRLVQA